jgi:hypothetical protein
LQIVSLRISKALETTCAPALVMQVLKVLQKAGHAAVALVKIAARVTAATPSFAQLF